ncbi:MAG TPA: serine/threonine-protein kinase [Myxococcaceae bacterium]|jgi:serine/threonine protein kinase
MSSVELPWTLAPAAHSDAVDPTRLAAGTRVGDWRVLSRHEAGTFGVVYLAVRVGEEEAGPRALKLSRRRNDARLEREVQLLARVEHSNVPRLHGHGDWQGFAYVVMDWVAGVDLYRWARLCNPPRRQVARLLSKLAWALSAVHSEGGMHRDLKGDNVLVRLANNEPVLTDFGAGTWSGAAPLTVLGPPGTPLYYSPERLRAHLNVLPPGSASGAGPADDVYALGVTAYRLLTDTYPFSELDEAHRTQERLRGRLPRAPHEVNPAVPPELSALVLRMLAALPEERPYVHEVNRALDRLIQSPAPGWEGLLFEWEEDPSRLGPGRRHREQVADELRRARQQAAESMSRVAAEVERVRAEQQAPTPRKSQEQAPARRPSLLEQPRALPWRQVARVALALAAVGLAALGMAWALKPGLVAGPPPASLRPLPTLEVGNDGQELALPRKLPESENGAAPLEARTPAPAANAALPKDRNAVKKKNLDAAGKAVGVALCTGLACATPAPIQEGPALFPLRPYDPPAEACPRGAVEAMAEHGIRLGTQHTAIFVGYENGALISRREGPVLILNDERWGDLPGSVVFAGRLLFGRERVYIRLTEARLEDGQRFPVCIDIYDAADRRGSEVRPGSTRDEVRMSNVVQVRAVDRFD